ncbi:ABC transporter permease [Lacisediminihabitans sp.]|jgi:ABC-2 type transport system permease protein|uniref:ABC transporter permease n=1 Tax=Lacisediminihabitans sp. TaxID=2787631 RepID=UPI002F956DB0
MTAFFTSLWIQLRVDVRDRGTLLVFYLVPLVFFFVFGGVLASLNPLMKDTLAATMTIFAVTMGTLLGVPEPIVKMRESGTLRAYRANGIPGSAVIGVQATSAFLHLLLVSAIIYLAAPIVFQARLPQAPFSYLLVLVTFIVASIAVGLLIGAVAPSQSWATMLSMFVFLPSLLLSGIMFPATMLPDVFLWIGRVFPATHALQAFYGFAYRGTTEIDRALALGILAGIAVVAFAAAVWRFGAIRRNEPD